MFEILLLIGFFTAGMSQLLPDGTKSPVPKQQKRINKAGKTNYAGTNRRASRRNLRQHSKVKTRSNFLGRDTNHVLNSLRNLENSSAGIGFPK